MTFDLWSRLSLGVDSERHRDESLLSPHAASLMLFLFLPACVRAFMSVCVCVLTTGVIASEHTLTHTGLTWIDARQSSGASSLFTDVDSVLSRTEG